MNLKKLFLLINTIKYLKPTQFYYRLFYFVRKRIRRVTGFSYDLSKPSHAQSLTLQTSIISYTSYGSVVKQDCFQFLNIHHSFNNSID